MATCRPESHREKQLVPNHFYSGRSVLGDEGARVGWRMQALTLQPSKSLPASIALRSTRSELGDVARRSNKTRWIMATRSTRSGERIKRIAFVPLLRSRARRCSQSSPHIGSSPSMRDRSVSTTKMRYPSCSTGSSTDYTLWADTLVRKLAKMQQMPATLTSAERRDAVADPGCLFECRSASSYRSCTGRLMSSVDLRHSCMDYDGGYGRFMRPAHFHASHLAPTNMGCELLAAIGCQGTTRGELDARGRFIHIAIERIPTSAEMLLKFLNAPSPMSWTDCVRIERRRIALTDQLDLARAVDLVHFRVATDCDPSLERWICERPACAMSKVVLTRSGACSAHAVSRCEYCRQLRLTRRSCRPRSRRAPSGRSYDRWHRGPGLETDPSGAPARGRRGSVLASLCSSRSMPAVVDCLSCIAE